jgi:hypothetical protein
MTWSRPILLHPPTHLGPERHEVVLDAARKLERWGAARDWVGSDPYDGLNYTRLVPALRSRLASRLVTQAVKRSPLDLRPLLGVPPAVSSVTLAHLVAAYAQANFLPIEAARAKLERSIHRLIEARCPGLDEPCWGYHFDVHTRVFSYPKGAPNTIATAFAGLALLDAHEFTGDERALEFASGAAEFFLRHVPQTEDADGAFFGYLVGDRTPIHNSSMLVSALLARLGRRLNRSDLTRAAGAGAAYTIARQRPDGSWPYGEQPHLSWVDNFHTGYVMECLLTCHEQGAVSGALPALEQGLAFYSRALFGSDGAPKYTPKSQYPIDCQCVAQAIQTFSRAAPLFPTYRAWADRSFDFAMRRMRRPDGAFVFQRRRLWVNRTPHMRWCEAPMLAALTRLSGLLADQPVGE